MALAPGTTLGSYSVTAKIGEGGMGEVYRARDTKLDRDVALKVLPQAFTDDPDRLTRFEREAKVLASLNHPNIGHIYGLEEAEGQKALVLELVEGPTLADRIAQGPIPVDEALPIAKQIAEALEAAHEQGVIHRDLKPANIKVREDGTVKVLDFGLAKAFQPDASDPALSQSPTISLTAAATQMGMVIGTAAYMAPEQAKGLTVDKRADIWAYGAVLFEMLTGKRLFGAGDVSEMLASVLVKDPEISSISDDVPAHLRSVIRHCLVKDPKKRLRDVGDVRLAMEGAFETDTSYVPTSLEPPKVRAWQRPVPAALLALVLLLTGSFVTVGLRPGSEPVAQLDRFVIGASEGAPTPESAGQGNTIALSSDGTVLVYIAGGQLYLRSLGELTPRSLPGTDNPHHPFFSPDGRWVGFFTGDRLQKIPLSGGSALTVTEVEDAAYRGATWTPDDRIIFGGLSSGLTVVSASGGPPEALTTLDAEAGDVAHRWPEMLPGGAAILFMVIEEGATTRQLVNARIALLNLETGEQRVLLDEEDYNARYVLTGHIVYARSGMLLAAPFDVDDLVITAPPILILEGVRFRPAGAVDFDISDSGLLAYINGGSNFEAPRTFIWVDREGNEAPVEIELRRYREFGLSPDGTRTAVRVAAEDNDDVWILDLDRNTSSRLTLEPATEAFPIWTPDGSRVAFGRPDFPMSWKAADGTGDVVPLTEERLQGPAALPQTFSPDGAELVYRQGDNLGVLMLDGEPSASLILETSSQLRNAALSSDGRWLAYESDESGRFEVYVRPFPDVDTSRQQVSGAGGYWPVWNPNGQELFYITGENRLVAVAVESEPSLTLGAVVELFDTSPYQNPVSGSGNRSMAVTPDGQRFLMLKDEATLTESDVREQVHIVFDWFEELTARVPAP